jgi:sarcosine oxidase, subunit beta
MPEHVETAIVGGGIVGCAVAYYLAELGSRDVLVVERTALGSGSTGGSFGGVRQQFSTPLEIEFSRRGLEFWRTCEQVFDSACPFHQDGYLFVSGRHEIVGRLRQAADLQRRLGLTDVHMLDPRQIEETIPWVSGEGLLGGCWTPGDGHVTPTDGVAALSRAARRLGVRFEERWEVGGIEQRDGGWLLRGPREVVAERVVVAAGYWTPALVRPFGLELGIRPVPLYGAITAPALEGQPVPLTIDLDTGLEVEREGRALLIAILLEENPPGFDHTRMLAEFHELARLRAPAIADIEIARYTLANVDLGGDGHPYVGEVEDGLWMIAGFSGHGTMHGPVVARLLAGIMSGQPDPTLDIASLDPRRDAAPVSEWMVATRKE